MKKIKKIVFSILLSGLIFETMAMKKITFEKLRQNIGDQDLLENKNINNQNSIFNKFIEFCKVNKKNGIDYTLYKELYEENTVEIDLFLEKFNQNISYNETTMGDDFAEEFLKNTFKLPYFFEKNKIFLYVPTVKLWIEFFKENKKS